MSSQFALAPSVLVTRRRESFSGSLVYGWRRGGMRDDAFIVRASGGRNCEDAGTGKLRGLSIRNPSGRPGALARRHFFHYKSDLGVFIFLIFLCVSLRFCLSYTLRLVACCRRRQKMLEDNTYTVHLSALPLTCLNASELQVKHISELQDSFICLQRAEGSCPLQVVPTQLALTVRQCRLNVRL